nr:hypothetical protein [Leptospira ryugenii]
MAQTFCLGEECSKISSEVFLAGFLVDPLLERVYTNDFLSAMGQSAVLQNINSSMIGGTPLLKRRVGLGYSAARSRFTREYVVEGTELRELPNLGVASSPNLSYGLPLFHFFPDSPFLSKVSVQFHFFPYALSETNIPFLKIRNTEVGGKVWNAGISLRYFPGANLSADSDTPFQGFSFGLGLYHTNQEVSLYAYDRRPTQFNLDGDRRRWIGINDLRYDSRILSVSTDIRYTLSFENLSLYAGLGGVYNSGKIRIEANRYAAISLASNRDDFSSAPSFVGLNLRTDFALNKAFLYGTLGLQYKWSDFGIGLEYLRNQTTESANVAVHYYF